jgi:hypothetical protein
MIMSRKNTPTVYKNTGFFLVCVSIIMILSTACDAYTYTNPPPTPAASYPFIASIDTMKVSRDTQQRQLSQSEIADIVNLSASLHTNYITVDTNWDYPAYMQEWVNAVRAVHLHVWFRSHPNQWESDNGMTPAEYEATEQAFIEQHPTLFQSGDIFDPCSEPEQGPYWQNEYNAHWVYNAPNNATRAFNSFLRDTTDVADKAFQHIGISGVITTIRSTNSFFATHPDVLEKATVEKFQRITVDSYPDTSTTDPATAAQARVEELRTIENVWHMPIVIGEMGYSNSISVDDQTQHQVLKAELAAISALPYVSGVNYWVGAGSNTAGGYTYIIAKNSGKWSLRPAASDLSAFYEAKLARARSPQG